MQISRFGYGSAKTEVRFVLSVVQFPHMSKYSHATGTKRNSRKRKNWTLITADLAFQTKLSFENYFVSLGTIVYFSIQTCITLLYCPSRCTVVSANQHNDKNWATSPATLAIHEKAVA
ncbi:hypothetical protein BaRGS_00017797 [Batillaria attramentaria]|uniref:Uncharacterized protein n=1 Tax=Batillaria attramentaria TaxID=370345 RepID=A0ABD0KUU4_9CAEN